LGKLRYGRLGNLRYSACNYADAGSIKLWAIEELMEDLMAAR